MTKVTSLVLYGTKYELVLTDGQQTYLVAYTLRKSKTMLLRAIRNRGTDLLAICRLADDARFLVDANAARLGADWTVRFTGRTQKDAICTRSEYRYVGAVAAEQTVR